MNSPATPTDVPALEKRKCGGKPQPSHESAHQDDGGSRLYPGPGLGLGFVVHSGPRHPLPNPVEPDLKGWG